jgi:hypothetical protein
VLDWEECESGHGLFDAVDISAFDCLDQGKRPRFEFGTSTVGNGGNSLARSEARKAGFLGGWGCYITTLPVRELFSDDWQNG